MPFKVTFFQCSSCGFLIVKVGKWGCPYCESGAKLGIVKREFSTPEELEQFLRNFAVMISSPVSPKTVDNGIKSAQT